MKKIFALAPLFLLSVFFLFFAGCELEDIDPDADPRLKFLGTWQFNESELKSNQAFYQVTISIDPGNTAQVLLRNFGNIGNFHSATGLVTGNRITIASQNVASVTVDGSGIIINDTRMNWSYTLEDGADRKEYSAIAEKK